MKTKGFLEILTEKILGVEKPPTRDEQALKVLKDSGLFKLTECTPKQVYENRFVNMIDEITEICPAVDDDEDPNALTKTYDVDDTKLKENFEFLKNCDENYEEVCRVMLENKAGNTHYFGLGLAYALKTYNAYFNRGCKSFRILETSMDRFMELNKKINSDFKASKK